MFWMENWSLEKDMEIMRTQEMEPYRTLVCPSISGHRGGDKIMEQRGEGNVVKEMGKCRWQ
jgi:hypothetical protein